MSPYKNQFGFIWFGQTINCVWKLRSLITSSNLVNIPKILVRFSTFDEKVNKYIESSTCCSKKAFPTSIKDLEWSNKINELIAMKQDTNRKIVIIFFTLKCVWPSGLIPKNAKWFFNSIKSFIATESTLVMI